MELGTELKRIRQMSELLALCGYYHLFKLGGNLIDGPEGVLEQRIGQLLARRLLRHLDLQVEVSGEKWVRDLQRYCVVSSHASHVDWAVLLGYFPSPLRFIAKKELARVPVIGSYLRLRGVLIDRSQGLDATQAIARAARDGQPWPILIFPEGTRSPDGTIRPFKTAGLRVLAEAGLSMVPVCILGTYEVFPRYARVIQTGRRLRLVIGEPVHPADYPSVSEAVAEVERRVREAFAANQAEGGASGQEGALRTAVLHGCPR
jgi:1-acyl-sn-glycerol-3-phosphate acyltransferase